MSDKANAINAGLVALLRDARERQKISMEALAKQAGVHRTYVGLLERGRRQPTVVIAAALSEALGLSLSELLIDAERLSSDEERDDSEARLIKLSEPRKTSPSCIDTDSRLQATTALDAKAILAAVDDAYHTLDLLDGQLMKAGLAPFSELVELANLSSMLGNVLGAAIARHSKGAYERSGPHKYQDLRSTNTNGHIEIKTALERNKPKGHLAKPGLYLTFRYVLASRDGKFQRNRRGDTPFLWEIRFGKLRKSDFDVSNTPGDSGKTAVVKTKAFRKMERIYFDPEFFPYADLNGPWGVDK